MKIIKQAFSEKDTKMIISKKYAKTLINQGSAVVVSTMRENHRFFTVLDRLDLCRVDHYEITEREYDALMKRVIIHADIANGCTLEGNGDPDFNIDYCYKIGDVKMFLSDMSEETPERFISVPSFLVPQIKKEYHFY